MKSFVRFIYALNQERYLRVFLIGGEIPNDNNTSETSKCGLMDRLMRPEFCEGT